MTAFRSLVQSTRLEKQAITLCSRQHKKFREWIFVEILPLATCLHQHLFVQTKARNNEHNMFTPGQGRPEASLSRSCCVGCSTLYPRAYPWVPCSHHKQLQNLCMMQSSPHTGLVKQTHRIELSNTHWIMFITSSYISDSYNDQPTTIRSYSRASFIMQTTFGYTYR